MNILITGGYGFIGNHIAERFYKEGHQIYIVDKEDKRLKKYFPFRHKYYQVDVRDSKCEEIFKKQIIDEVIHLADSGEEDALECLEAVLKQVIQYHIPRFIYLASTQIYDQIDRMKWQEGNKIRPCSAQSMCFYMIEEYLDFVRATQDVSISVLRVSQVYAPTNKRTKRVSNKIYYIQEILDDYVYIGDVVDAVYKVSQNQINGVLNICTNVVVNSSYLKAKLGMEYTEPIQCIQKDDVTDYARQQLGWQPKYSLEKGLKRVQSQGYEMYLQVQENKKRKNPLKLIKRAVPYIENILTFLVVVSITNFLKGIGIELLIDLKLVYIITITMIYGLNQAYLAVLLGSVFYIMGAVEENIYLASVLYNPNTLLNIGTYIFIGGFLGYRVDYKEKELEDKDNNYKKIKEQFKFIKTLHNQTIEENKKMEYEILTREDSVGKIYHVTKELNFLTSDKIFDKIISITQQLVKVENIAVYSVSTNKKYLRLQSQSNASKNNWMHSINLEKELEIKEILNQKGVYINKELNPLLPMMAMPIYIENRGIALIVVDDICYERFNQNTYNLFKITVQMITDSLVKAYQYEGVIHTKKYIESTKVLTSPYFIEVIQNKEEAKLSGISESILLSVKNTFNYKNYKRIEQSIRETDYMGIDKDGLFYILLSGTTDEGGKQVIERLKFQGVQATAISKASLILKNNQYNQLKEG